MSNSEHSTVAYTFISSDDGSLDVGSLGFIVLGYDGLPMMPEDPHAYVEAAMQEPPPPDFVPEPVYPEFIPPEDDVLLADEQPLPAAVPPSADSPGYITEFDPEEDLEEDDDKDPGEDPADYPTDKDDDEEEEESSIDDADDEERDEDEDEEEKEHLAEVDRLLAIPTPPSSPLTPLSLLLPRIPSPPFPVPSPLPASPTHPLGYRAAMIRLRAELPSTSHPLPPPIVLPHTRASMVMMRVAAPSTYILAPQSETPPSETPPSRTPPLFPYHYLHHHHLCFYPLLTVEECSSAPIARPTGGFRVNYGFVGTLDAEIRRDPYREIGYEITDVWEDPDDIAEEIPMTDVAELSHRMTNFVTTVRQDTDEIYKRLEDAQDDRLLMSGQLISLRGDRHSHARTARLMESRPELLVRLGYSLWMPVIWHTQLAEALTLLKTLQTHMVALQSQQRPARDQAHPDVSDEVGSSS
uniref:Uncharacterized protein n=1 Tax=Tanacetum cinerariifolium TaxID=118510 RepID=A0A6L2NSR7_TANCI|nr:hypothetical protein [Tanacetum cinerariifolium]